jgi:methionine synthase I (cobalamin-dependent)
MGSALIERGLEPGRAPEEWNLTRPDVVCAIHRAYLDAGADVVTTNTFGSTPSRMARHGLLDRFAEVNRAAVRLARGCVDASPGSRFVAVSLGPTGMMFPPMGEATEASIASEFCEQLDSAGADVDLVLIETVFDLREGLIALHSARERSAVPVAVTMTFNRTPRGFHTVMGDGVAAAVKALDAAGADVVGANCSIASGDMLDLAPLLRAATDRPVLCQPNAGQPHTQGATTVYEQSPGAFADHAARLFDLGVNAVGGCCGTTPEFIGELCARMTT